MHAGLTLYSCWIADRCPDQRGLHRLLGTLQHGKHVVNFPRKQQHPAGGQSPPMHVRKELHCVQSNGLLHLQQELQKGGEAAGTDVLPFDYVPRLQLHQ